MICCANQLTSFYMIDWFLCKFLLKGISEPTIVITCGLQNENEKEQKGTYISFILCKLMIPQLIHQWMAIKVNYVWSTKYTRIFFNKKPRTRYLQITPNLRNVKNYFDLRNWYNTKLDEYRVVFPDKSEDYFKLDDFNGVDVILEK